MFEVFLNLFSRFLDGDIIVWILILFQIGDDKETMILIIVAVVLVFVKIVDYYFVEDPWFERCYCCCLWCLLFFMNEQMIDCVHVGKTVLAFHYNVGPRFIDSSLSTFLTFIALIEYI